MILSDVVPVETVNEDNTQTTIESSDNEPPSLRKRKGEDDENSVESSKAELEIDWNLGDLIPEFRQTYHNELRIQSKQEQEIWIEIHLKKEGLMLTIFHEMFSLRTKYLDWHQDLKSDEDIIREEDIQIIQSWRSLGKNGSGEVLQKI